MLYYVDRVIEPLVEVFKPQIPKYPMYDECTTIPHICLCNSIEGCLSAASWGGNNLVNHFQDEVFRLYCFDENNINAKNLIFNDELWEKGLVPDAFITGEIWVVNQILKPYKIYYITIEEFDEEQLPICSPTEWDEYYDGNLIIENFGICIKNVKVSFHEKKELFISSEINSNNTEKIITNIKHLLPKEVSYYMKDEYTIVFDREIVILNSKLNCLNQAA